MSTFIKQFALLGETAAMAFDTLRSNKMRSALTVLGVVIGVTSIVGMTSLIRGFDTSLRESISSLSACSMVLSGQNPRAQVRSRDIRSEGMESRNASPASSSPGSKIAATLSSSM